jgi:sugar phosphate isomerase/epimerase
MDLKFFCPRWGSDQIEWNDFMQKIKTAGYEGVEYGIANDAPAKELDDVWEIAAKHGVEIIPQHYGTYDADYNRHYDTFAAWFEKVRPYPAVKIDSQTGKDFFTFEQNKSLIDITINYTKSSGVEVYHETHRNKFPFAAHITRDYLERIPYLKLTLDVSHWVNVAESYLEDQQETMDLAILRTEHLHARVGYPEGPQVPDPRVPEWKEAVDHHLVWWDKVIERKRNEGPDITMTITPEFGPYPYMVHLPHSLKPIADQWEVNLYMMNLLKERYAGR